jgi:hypothetical protein
MIDWDKQIRESLFRVTICCDCQTRVSILGAHHSNLWSFNVHWCTPCWKKWCASIAKDLSDDKLE